MDVVAKMNIVAKTSQTKITMMKCKQLQVIVLGYDDSHSKAPKIVAI